MSQRLRLSHQEDVKDKIQASQLVNLLQDHALGKKKSKVSPDRIKAAEILLARTIPVLSSVEQTINDDRDKLSEDQVLAELQGLFAAKPHLLDKLLSLRQALEVSGEASKAIDTASKRLDITIDMQHS